MINFSLGPVMIEEEILEIGAEQIPYFRTDEFSEIVLENEEMIKELIECEDDARVVFLTASGTGAMEAAVMNFFKPRDKVLVVNGGSFGERFKKLCEIYELDVEEIKLKYGEILKEEHLEAYENSDFKGFLINVHETSTGILYNMDLVGDFCKRNNIFLIVDAISSFLADNYNMSRYKANVTIISSQKALGLPPGMAYIVLDRYAQEKVFKINYKGMYFNIKDYLIHGNRGQTPYTPAVSIMMQLNKKLKSIKEYGITNTIERVNYLATDFRKKIIDLPFDIAYSSLSNALTPIRVKGKMNAYEIFKYLKDNKGIFICPNGGELSEVIFRVGHIGNISIKENDILINALKEMHIDGIL